MKKEINFVKPALGGPQSTTVAARMTKVQDGRIYAYGGTFCLSTPLSSPLECGFFPEPVLAFYSRPREGATFTEQDGKLIMRHGNLEQTTQTVAVTCIPTLQAVGKRFEVTRQLENLSTVAALCRNNTPSFDQGAWFKEGMIFALHKRSTCFSTDGFEFEHPEFGIPADTMLALSHIKVPLVAVVYDRQALQFEFEDGSWLATRLLEGLSTPDFLGNFDGFDDPDKFVKLTFDPEVMLEVLSFKLHGEEDGIPLDMIWIGQDGNLSFVAPDRTEGTFTDAYEGDANFRIKGEALRTIFSLKPELTGLLRRNTSSPAHSLNGYGPNFAVAACLSR